MKKLSLLSSLFLTLSLSAQPPSYVPTSGLVAWWGFTGNANDSSGNNNNLTVNGATLTTDRNGTANAAYAFNGTSSYLTNSALSHSFSQTGTHSISFWIKKTGNTEGVALMSGSNTAANFIWLLQCDTSKTIYGTNKQGQSWTWLNGPNYSTTQWEHYVAVYNNQTMQLFKNGTAIGTTTNTYTSTSQAVLPIYIGRAISGGYISASIDDIGIWNRTLTATEISQLYSSVLSTKEVKSQGVTGSIVPNPAIDYIQINFPLKESKPYKIMDMSGRILSKGEISNEEKINISELSKGTYFVEIEDVKKLKFLKK
jgi:hypothetical protein